MPEQIAGNRDIAIGNSDTLTVVSDSTVRIGHNSSSRVQHNQSLSAGKNFVVQAGDMLELVCAAASIVMKKDGTIVIKGKDITIEGSGKINARASGEVVLKGSKLTQN